MVRHQRSFHTIRGRLRLLLFIVFFPAILIQTGYFVIRYQNLEAAALQTNMEIARVASETIREFIQSILHQELAIGINLTTARDLTVQQMNQILAANKTEHPPVRAFSWYDPRNNQVLAASTGIVGLDYGDRDYIRRIVSGREWAVSDLFISRAPPHTPLFTISRGIRSGEGSLLGIVIAGIAPEQLKTILTGELPAGWAVTLFDSQGCAVYRYPEQEWTWGERNMLARRPAVRQAVTGSVLSGVFPSVVHEERVIAAYAPVSLIGWAVCAERSFDVVASPIRTQILEQAGLFLLLFVLIFTVAVRVSDSVSSPIKQLREHAVALGHGKVDQHLEPSGPVEIQDLVASFNVMAGEIAGREEELRRKEATLRGIVDATGESMWLFSPDGYVLMASETTLLRLGKPGEEVIGRHLRDILPPEPAELRLARLREAVGSGRPVEFEDQHRGILFHHSLYPVLDSGGQVTGVASFSRDITQQKLAQETLRASEERLRLALQAAKAGMWEWNLDTNENIWSDELWKLYGIEPDACEPSYEAWRQTIHPDDVEKTVQSVREASKSGTEFEAEWRVRNHSGAERWLMARGRPVRDVHGQLKRFIGVVMDITERKLAEEALRENKAKLESALASMADSVFISDVHGRFVDFNDAFATFHRFKDKAECYKTLAEYPGILDVFMPGGELAPLDMWAVPRALRGETATNAEYMLRRKDTGETWTGSYSFAPIRDKDGAVVGSVVVCRDVTERNKMEKALRDLIGGEDLPAEGGPSPGEEQPPDRGQSFEPQGGSRAQPPGDGCVAGHPQPGPLDGPPARGALPLGKPCEHQFRRVRRRALCSPDAIFRPGGLTSQSRKPYHTYRAAPGAIRTLRTDHQRTDIQCVEARLSRWAERESHGDSGGCRRKAPPVCP